MLLSLLLMAWLCPSTVLASADWPDNVSIESDAGIIMDANSGAVIYGKNIHSTYAPASITKVLTALIVLERCSMDETVTFPRMRCTMWSPTAAAPVMIPEIPPA